MRVLHLTAGNLYGGIETLLVTLARCRRLCPEMEPHFGLCFGGRLHEELTAAGVPTHVLGRVRLSRPWTTWQARRRLRDLLRRTGFDAVVTHASWPHVVFAPAVRRSKARLVHVVHDNPVSPTWFDRRAARTPPDLVIANSRFTATAAAKLFQGVSVEVLYHPVEEPNLADRHEVRRAVRASLGTDRNAVVVLQASRLEEWKGQAVHLDALARLKEVPGWEAWFAGGGQKPGEQEYLNTLRTRAERAGIGNRVRFLGQRSDVPRLMAAADVYCQPNTGPEPFGIVYVEALYAGLPAVASDFGGSAEIVDETCGLLAPPGDANAVAKLLGELVRNPKLRSTLGQCGPRRAAQLCDPGLALSRLSEYVFADALVKA